MAKVTLTLVAFLSAFFIHSSVSAHEEPFSGFGYPIVASEDGFFLVEFVYDYPYPDYETITYEERISHKRLFVSLEVSKEGAVLKRSYKVFGEDFDVLRNPKRRYKIDGKEYYALYGKGSPDCYLFPMFDDPDSSRDILRCPLDGIAFHDDKKDSGCSLADLKSKPTSYARYYGFATEKYDGEMREVWDLDSALIDGDKIVYSVVRSVCWPIALSALIARKDFPNDSGVSHSIGYPVHVYEECECSPLFKLSGAYGLLFLDEDALTAGGLGDYPCRVDMKIVAFDENNMRSETIPTSPRLDHMYFDPQISAAAIGNLICVAYSYPLGNERGLVIELLEVSKEPFASRSLIASRKMVVKMDKPLQDMPENPNKRIPAKN